MPLTYHFSPFPPADSHLDLQRQSTKSGPSSPTSCRCHNDIVRCKQCRQQAREEKFASSRPSQTMLPSIREERDPLQRALTPKEIRDQRRASSRSSSVSAAFNEAVGNDDYFTLFHSAAFARSPSVSSRRLRRQGSASGSQSRKTSAEEACLPPIPDLERTDSDESVDETAVEGEPQDLTRRDS